MQTKTGEWEGPGNPQRSAVRYYAHELGQRIALAVHEMTHCYAGADGLCAEAGRFAENGLPLLEVCCKGRLAAGWAASLIATIASLRCGGGDQPPGVLAATALAYFNAAFVALEKALPPEGGMPKLIYSASQGLSHDTRTTRCRVTLPRAVEGEGILALIDGCPVEPVLRARKLSVITRLIENCEAGKPGLTNRDLGTDRPAVTELRKYAHWREVLDNPGVRGAKGCLKVNRLHAA